eukprot:m.163446 g.163446  ORF g.163446 m.163446 type:complete len:128 (+) comp14385_c1_seq1:3969-4352(+)
MSQTYASKKAGAVKAFLWSTPLQYMAQTHTHTRNKPFASLCNAERNNTTHSNTWVDYHPTLCVNKFINESCSPPTSKGAVVFNGSTSLTIPSVPCTPTSTRHYAHPKSHSVFSLEPAKLDTMDSTTS